MISILVNGQSRDIPPGTSVHGLLEHLSMAGKKVAVERNGEIVPRGQHARVHLQPGDRLEIVVAVGGG